MKRFIFMLIFLPCTIKTAQINFCRALVHTAFQSSLTGRLHFSGFIHEGLLRRNISTILQHINQENIVYRNTFGCNHPEFKYVKKAFLELLQAAKKL